MTPARLLERSLAARRGIVQAGRAIARLGVALGLILLLSPSLRAAQAQGTGTVRGTVTDAKFGGPAQDVQVIVVGGTRRGAVTDAAGRYSIVGVPAGRITVRAQRIGYSPMSREVVVTSGETAQADFSLTSAVMSLDEVVVTGTPGATEKRTLGNAVSSIKAEDLTATVPVPNVTEMLQGRSAGINVVTNSGSVGTSATIRIRGAGSMSANSQPIYYIDGIRMNSGAQTSFDNSGASAQATSALDAINPNDIESIEVIKGPAAATLYGADAASGVIQIITKKGKAGKQGVQWTAKGEDGSIDWALERPKRYWYCTDAQIANAVLYPNCATLGANPANRLLVDDPFNAPGALRTGSVKTYGMSARGGGERYSFFISGDHDGENGVLYNNSFERNNGRTNFQVAVLDNLNVSVNTAFARTNSQQPLSDNSSNSILRNAYRDRPSGPWPWQAQFRGLGPNQSNQYDNRVNTERYILGTTVEYEPLSWFHNRLNAGVDVNNQTSALFYGIDTTGRLPFGSTVSKGYISYLLPTTHQWTLDYAGTANAMLPRELTSAFSVGVQYARQRIDSYQATGQGLVANSLNLVGSAATTTADQTFLEQKSLGTYAQEMIGWRNRLFVTGALRVDNNSAFGSNFKFVTYPKASVAYVVSEEPFFHVPYVDQLKLRGAWGEAGNAPQPFSAVRAFSAVQTAIGDVAVNALQPQAYGNPDLRAETGREIELGFDLSALKGRLGAEFTYYNKQTKDALVSVPAPPSTGFVGAGNGAVTGSGATGTYLANLGQISNTGLELTVTANPFSAKNLNWETVIAASTNHNSLVSFGTGFNEISFSTFGQIQKFSTGFPLGAYWATDVVRDGTGAPVLTGGKVTVDTLKYLGPSSPTREASFSNTFTIFKNFRLYGYLDYKGGFYLFNGIKYVNDRLDQNTAAVNDPNFDPIQKQILLSGATLPDIVRADFIKLRELSLGYTLPQNVAGRFGANSATVSFSARNLAIWKLNGYSGLDPEVSFFNGTSGTAGVAASPQALFDRTDYASIPMLRRLVATLNLSF
jgi:TonB-linked SusC/RagA family outer membrane protein